MNRVYHEIEPVYDQDSKILILGSFPSVKSRENHFFYGHPQNRFWKVLENLYDVHFTDIESKKKFLHEKHIALWDVIESCEIEGSSDSSIKNIKLNDIKRIIDESAIEKVFVNGRKAQQYYDKYILDKTKMPCIPLPSTSPANAAYTLEKLIMQWKQIKE